MSKALVDQLAAQKMGHQQNLASEIQRREALTEQLKTCERSIARSEGVMVGLSIAETLVRKDEENQSGGKDGAGETNKA